MTRREFATLLAARSASAQAGLRQIRDIVIYSDELYYSAFPSIIRRRDGELLVAFRRAPNRRLMGEKAATHTDPNSYCVLVRSRDGGETWTREPELIAAHPWGGSQDPCLIQLRDGSILCASYLWTWLNRQAGAQSLGTVELGQYVFQGGYLMRSEDGGRSWKGPIYPPPLAGRDIRNGFGKPLPVYNRGAMCQGRDGRLYWAVAYPKGERGQTDVHLMISSDRGDTWHYASVVATDEKVVFNEASLYETPKGDLVAFLRTAGFNDHTVVARSRNGGRSFEPWQDAGWQGHPHHAVQLEDGRVFLVYGYRHPPYGIRARILDAECSDFAAAPEFVLRDDGGNGDLGYPWAVALPGRRILATYYFNQGDGLRHIAGSFLAY